MPLYGFKEEKVARDLKDIATGVTRQPGFDAVTQQAGDVGQQRIFLTPSEGIDGLDPFAGTVPFAECVPQLIDPFISSSIGEWRPNGVSIVERVYNLGWEPVGGDQYVVAIQVGRTFVVGMGDRAQDISRGGIKYRSTLSMGTDAVDGRTMQVEVTAVLGDPLTMGDVEIGDQRTVHDPQNLFTDAETNSTGWAEWTTTQHPTDVCTFIWDADAGQWNLDTNGCTSPYHCPGPPSQPGVNDLDTEDVPCIETRFEIVTTSLPLNKVVGTLKECLSLPDNTVEVEVDDTQFTNATYPNRDIPPEFGVPVGGKYTVIATNAMRSAAATGTNVLLERARYNTDSDPTNQLTPKVSDISTTFRWNIVTIDYWIAKWATFIKSSGSGWVFSTYADGTDPLECGFPVGLPLFDDKCVTEGSVAVGFYNPEASSANQPIYTLIATESAFHGQILNSDGDDICLSNFCAAVQDCDPYSKPDCVNETCSWRYTGGVWVVETECPEGCRCTSSPPTYTGSEGEIFSQACEEQDPTEPPAPEDPELDCVNKQCIREWDGNDWDTIVQPCPNVVDKNCVCPDENDPTASPPFPPAPNIGDQHSLDCKFDDAGDDSCNCGDCIVTNINHNEVGGGTFFVTGLPDEPPQSNVVSDPAPVYLGEGACGCKWQVTVESGRKFILQYSGGGEWTARTDGWSNTTTGTHPGACTTLQLLDAQMNSAGEIRATGGDCPDNLENCQ